MSVDQPDRGDLPLYTAGQMRALDRNAIEQAGIPGYTLMTRAATAAWTAIRERWPAAGDILVLCGGGNNGGDGYVLARLANEVGCRVRVLAVGDTGKVRGDAATAREAWLATGANSETLGDNAGFAADLIVDALLGTGFSGALDGDWQQVVQSANASAAPVVSLDIPSGLACDTGQAGGEVIRAALTITFIGRKAGLYTGEGPACTGEIVFDDLGVPAGVYQQVPPVALLDNGCRPNPFTKPRARTAHKGHFGHVLVIGGDHGMNGAARLAGEAALRSGAGRVTVATRTEHAAIMAAACPELMCHGVERAADIKVLLAKASVVVIGPGLGQSGWARAMFSAVLESTCPQVLDADALNLLAVEPVKRHNWILTPHPGEAARLLQTRVSSITADRMAAVQALQATFGGSIALKGAGTIVSSGDDALPVICSAGNPGMATAGAGDVLAGIAGALLAQGLDRATAARAAVCLHAVAGDRATLAGERGRLARDLIAELPGLLQD